MRQTVGLNVVSNKDFMTPHRPHHPHTDLHAQRLGHGYNVFSKELVKVKENPQNFVDGLVQYCAKARIVFEVCLTSNRQVRW